MNFRKILITLAIPMTLSLVACQASDETGTFDESLLNEQDFPGQFSLTDKQTADAEEMAGRFPDKDERLIRLAARLSLTDAQVEAISPILDSVHEQMMAIHGQMKALHDSGERPSREQMKEMHDQVKAIHDAADTEIKALLSDEQAAEYETLIAECKKNREARCSDGSSGESTYSSGTTTTTPDTEWTKPGKGGGMMGGTGKGPGPGKCGPRPGM